MLLTADYSQIELRLLAHFSQDALLVEAYRRGDDVHTLTASQVFGVPPLMVTADHRRQAKVVNFGIVYGLSAFGLSQNLGIEPSEAKQFITAYFEKYSGVRAFIDKTLEQARRDMKVKTLFGRVRPIPDINSKNANQRGFAERTAVNTPLQGLPCGASSLPPRLSTAASGRELPQLPSDSGPRKKYATWTPCTPVWLLSPTSWNSWDSLTSRLPVPCCSA